MGSIHELGRVLPPNNAVCGRWFSQLRCYRGLQQLRSNFDLCEFMVAMRNCTAREHAIERDLYRTAAVLHYNGVSEAHLKGWESRRAKAQQLTNDLGMIIGDEEECAHDDEKVATPPDDKLKHIADDKFDLIVNLVLAAKKKCTATLANVCQTHIYPMLIP